MGVVSFERLLWWAMCCAMLSAANRTSSSEVVTTSAEAFQCPDVCRCGLDGRGRVKVVCEKGAMMDPIPVRAMDPLTEVLVITASDDRPNTLTIGPIFQGLTKLEELRITHSFVPAIGKHSFWGLRSLSVLDLSSNNISALVESNFRALINLQSLDLEDNIIDSIPSAAFRHLPALKKLNLARNRVSEFVPRLFYGLHRLEELDLSSNPLADLETEVFRDIRLLRTLRCRDCGLTHINPLLLHLLPDLQTLDLGSNKFHYLTKAAFSGLPRLRHLHLDGNSLSVLTSAVLTGHNLTSLSLARNKLITVDPAAFVNVTIASLDLSQNHIGDLDPSLFIPLNRSLTSLKIGGNPLQVSHVWSAILSQRVNLSLTELDLANIPLGRDPYFSVELFSFQTALRSLNLSGTELTGLPAELVRPMSFLRELDVSRNQLSSLTDLTLSALTGLKYLKTVHLHGNPWHCDACVIGPLIKWLDVSPATRHTKNNCRGLKTNARNLSTAADDGAACPVCKEPQAVAGVELPRLDHINLPNCNHPPSLIDAGGLPSKVRLGGTSSLSNAQSISFDFLENPLYLALTCGTLTLIVLAVCAAVAVASRHAASYYTNEDKRHAAAQQEVETEGLPLCPSITHIKDEKRPNLFAENGLKDGPVAKKNRKNHAGHKNNNQRKDSKKTKPATFSVSRGVNCNNGSLYSPAGVTQ